MDQSSITSATPVATTALGKMLLLLLFLVVRETTRIAIAAALSRVEESTQSRLAIAAVTIRIRLNCVSLDNGRSRGDELWLLKLDFF